MSTNERRHSSPFVPLESISIFGAQIGYTLLPLIALYSVGASPFEMGVFTAVSFAPVILLGLVFGALIDTRDPQRVSLLASGFRLILLVILAAGFAVGDVGFPVLAGLVFLMSTASTAYDTSIQSLLPEIVPKNRVAKANSYFELGRSGGATVGPSLAGAVLALGGPALGIVVQFVAHTFGLLGVLAARRDRHRSRIEDTQPDGEAGRLWRRILSGVRYVIRRHDLTLAVSMAVMSNVAGGALDALLYVHLHDTYGLGATQAGVVTTVAGAVTIGGAVVAGRLADITSAARMMSATLVVSSICILGFALIPDVGAATVVVAGVVLGCEYSTSTLFNIRMISYRQRTVPATMLARANAAARTLIMSALPVGALLGGALGEIADTRIVLASIAFGTLAVTVLLATWGRGIGWTEDRELAVKSAA